MKTKKQLEQDLIDQLMIIEILVAAIFFLVESDFSQAGKDVLKAALIQAKEKLKELS